MRIRINWPNVVTMAITVFFIILFIVAAFHMMPCPTEDSNNCHWDAARGNGQGQSFIAISDTFLIYLP